MTALALQSWAILFWNILLLVTKWICFISYSSWQEALSTQNHRAKPKYLAQWRKSRCLLEPRDTISILIKKWPAGTAVCGLALHAFFVWVPRNKICSRLAEEGEMHTAMVICCSFQLVVLVCLRYDTRLLTDTEDKGFFGGREC